MTYPSLLTLLALSLALSACGTPTKDLSSEQAPPGAVISGTNAQLDLALASGTYRCEHGVKVQIERESRDRINHRIRIRWNGGSYQLDRDPSYSGLPRFQDMSSGLVWVDLPWKSLLLDGKSNKPLANECRSI